LFSRISLFVPKSTKEKDVAQLVCRKHIKQVGDILLVVFKWTKTLQTGGRNLVVPLVSIPGSILCPVTAYKVMSHLVPAPPSSPAFVYPSSLSPIPYRDFQQVFKQLVGLTGRDPPGYSSHSFRRGGASYAFKVGVPGELIQTQGDWVSECYKRYLQMDVGQRLKVVQSMAHAISS
jgi:hypothetical protein